MVGGGIVLHWVDLHRSMGIMHRRFEKSTQWLSGYVLVRIAHFYFVVVVVATGRRGF
jgi:hypothetical protein